MKTKNIINISKIFELHGFHAAADRAIIVASSEMANLAGLIPPALDKLYRAAGYQILAVGGSVRDALLGQPPKDIDLCSDASPEESLALCKSARLKTIETGLQHGTITVMINGEGYEITTFRVDMESDGRHADVAFVKDVNQDLGRRDFTINAMAVNQQGHLIDPYGGQEDLARGEIKAVGDPYKRFTEDYLRIIRAARFASRYGFKIDEGTWKAMNDLSGDLCSQLNIDERGGAISMERLTDEFSKAFKTQNLKQFIEIMSKLGIFKAIAPEFSDDILAKIKENIDKVPGADKWYIMFMWMAPEQIENVARRLKLPLTSLSTTVKMAQMRPIYEQLLQSEANPAQIRQFQTECGVDFGKIAEIFGRIYGQSNIITEEQERFSPVVQGRDLMTLYPGRKPGKWVGDVLRLLEDEQKRQFYETGISPSREKLLEKLREYDNEQQI